MFSEEDEILRVESVSKFFKSKGIPIIDNVSLEVHSGEIYGIIGSANSGKTTLLRMIAGLTKISSGDITICGYNIESDFKNAISYVGSMINAPALYSYMTGYENLKLMASYYDNISEQQILEVSRFVGMEKRLYNKASTYSLGMKQRISIAQALLNNPKLIILDEPTIGIDPNSVKELRAFLISLARCRNIAILLTGRRQQDVDNLCDTVAILDNGKIVKETSNSKTTKTNSPEQSMSIMVDYPIFANKIINNSSSINTKIKGKEISFKATDEQIAHILSKLSNADISIFDMSTTSKSAQEIFNDAKYSNVNNY